VLMLDAEMLSSH